MILGQLCCQWRESGCKAVLFVKQTSSQGQSRAGVQEASGPWVKQSCKKSIGFCLFIFLLGIPKQATDLQALVSLLIMVLQRALLLCVKLCAMDVINIVSVQLKI